MTPERMAELKKYWTMEMLLQYVEDTSESFDCLPRCDSYGHEEFCPSTNTVAAFRQVQQQLADTRAELEKWRDVVKNCPPFCLYECKFCKGKFVDPEKPYETFVHKPDCPWKQAQVTQESSRHE